MINRLPSYLHRNRCGVFGFRIVIPADLRLFFPAREYRLSLNTLAVSEAKPIAVGMAAFVQCHYQQVRKTRGQGMENQNKAFLRLLADEKTRLQGHTDAIAAFDELEIAALVELTAEILDEEIPSAGEALRHLSGRQKAINAEKAALASEAMLTAMKVSDTEIDGRFCDLHNRLARLKEQDAALRDEFQFFRHQVLAVHAGREHRAELQTVQEQAMLDRKRITELASDLIVNATAKLERAPGAAPAKLSTEQLSAVIEAYCEAQKVEGNWTSKTESENRAIYALWLRIVGDRPVGDYDFEQHRRYKSTMQRLPPNLNKDRRYKDKQIDDILALAHKPAALNTVNKNLVRVAALFHWAVKHGYTTTNPAAGMVMKNPKRANEERKSFTADDLNKLFQSPEYFDTKRMHPYMRWIPLIALYTGARLNEIAQLHLADFQTPGGIPVISINEEGDGKRLKTRAGRRLIPLHPELQRLGLLEYVNMLRNRGETRLFPELKKGRDGYGQIVSKWFARHRTRCGVIDSGKVFHSFRHTFIDRLKQKGAPKEKIAALVGHEDDSETFGRYGKDFGPTALLEIILMIDFQVI